MKSRIMKVALAVAVFFLMCGASFAQSPWWWLQRDRDQSRDGYWRYQDRDRDGRDDRYERGSRDGRSDRERHRAWHPREGSAPYMNGYRAGFGSGWQGRRDNDHDREVYRGPNAPNGPYNNGPYGAGNAGRVAYNNGYQEGLGYGQRDRSAGRRYTPTSSGVYSDATRGYNSSYGDKTNYRLTFRNGYVAGYQRGYYGR